MLWELAEALSDALDLPLVHDSPEDACRHEALYRHQEMDRLEREMSRGERRRRGESERPWRARKRQRLEQIFADMRTAAEAHSRVWEYGPMRKYRCPCCEMHTLDEEPPGTYEICRVCGWEDEGVQFDDPDYRGGTNQESLNEARAAFRQREQKP